jgi:hypothetical protein
MKIRNKEPELRQNKTNYLKLKYIDCRERFLKDRAKVVINYRVRITTSYSTFTFETTNLRNAIIARNTHLKQLGYPLPRDNYKYYLEEK